ncbi:hypothetical protein [Ensifer sp. LBL]|uniref:hypothetical protein n=1 Tax=Ensifer sp. LBL TaxID=2991056 RepID=UPI003D1BD702
MLEDYETDAVFALMVRVLKEHKRRDEAQKALEEAQKTISEANIAWVKGMEAIKFFCPEKEGADLWKEVAKALGNERYVEAFHLAGMGEDLEERVRQRALDNTQMSDADANIKDRVLELLRKAGSEGTTARTIIDELRSEGVEMHDKTVGMTLYRLSQDGQSRRQGRMWYPIELPTDGKDDLPSVADVFE